MNFFRCSIFTSVLAVVFAGPCLQVVAEDAKETPVIKTHPRPMELSELLSMLPACPDTWVVKRSQARTLYQESLEAYAMREYQEFVLPGLKKSKDERKPETVVMVIRDTCGLGPHIKPFREETAPMSGGDFKLGNWNRYPAMLVKTSNSRRSLRILVADRFVVEVVFTGNNFKALKWWMERCKLKALTEAKERIPVTIRDQVTLHFLDELHPERTRSYSVPIEPEKPDESAVASSLDKPQEIASE